MNGTTPDRTLGDLIGELVAIVAETCCEPDLLAEAEELRAAREAAHLEAAAVYRAARLAAHRAAVKRQPMLPVAARLARAVAAGDQAGTDVLLARPRDLAEWRQLAVILASAADPARLAPPAVPAAALPETLSAIPAKEAA